MLSETGRQNLDAWTTKKKQKNQPNKKKKKKHEKIEKQINGKRNWWLDQKR